MKKLIIAATLVISVVASHAASVSWNTEAFFIPTTDGTYSTTDKTTAKSVVGYLWEVNAATYEIYAADTSLIYAEFSKEGYGALGATTVDPKNSGMGRNVSLTGLNTYLEHDDVYALLLYTYRDADGKDWYIANAAKYENMGTSDVTISSLNKYEGGIIGTEAQGAAITGWTAANVPEPTSGLLLLVGMGALALRRKQK